MLGSRVMRQNPLFGMALVLVSLVCSAACAPLEVALPLDDPNAVMRIVLSSLKAVEQPVTGRGTAVMKIENFFGDLDGKELTMDFAFKDKKSRVDVFESDREHRGSRIRATARSDEVCIQVLHEVYCIDRPDNYDHAVGWDFHPDTFFQVLGEKSLAKWLQYELENPRPSPDTSIELEDNGILRLSIRAHIVVRREYDPKEYDVQVTISFDTQKGYRPVFYERKFTNADGSWHAMQAKLQWAKSDSTWYVSAFEYNELPSNHRHTVGKIESFKPNVEVADGEFTLEGMGIVDGMYVDDKVKGLRYWYKSPSHFAADPEIPLEEADLVQKIRAQQSSLASQTESGDANSVQTNEFYLRDYQTGRLIGPVSLMPGSLLPLLNKKNYIVADPAESELKVRKCLLESHGYESKYFDMPADEVVEGICWMLKCRLGDKAPPFQVEDADTLITMAIRGDTPAYDVLCDIAARAKLRLFVEDGAVVLSRKPLKELAGKL
ncbi:MAG TPA: hypothetical protein VMW24_03165 [Sedimentisphaerales bacterium]|nr:hypothetical protein [Sedimentisphaerales bacterium]